MCTQIIGHGKTSHIGAPTSHPDALIPYGKWTKAPRARCHHLVFASKLRWISNNCPRGSAPFPKCSRTPALSFARQTSGRVGSPTCRVLWQGESGAVRMSPSSFADLRVIALHGFSCPIAKGNRARLERRGEGRTRTPFVQHPRKAAKKQRLLFV